MASTTTTQGKSCNSAAALFFESFLNNNVPLGSMNELVSFIHNVIREERHYSDSDILDEDISIEECFYKLMSSTGWGWIPTEEEMEIIWNMITQLGQEDINRLFYKNNLFHFIDNSVVRNVIINFLCKLDKPYMDPNTVPEEAKDELQVVYDLMREYVYYQYQIIDRLDKMYYLIRSNSIIQDRIVSPYRVIYKCKSRELLETLCGDNQQLRNTNIKENEICIIIIQIILILFNIFLRKYSNLYYRNRFLKMQINISILWNFLMIKTIYHIS